LSVEMGPMGNEDERSSSSGTLCDPNMYIVDNLSVAANVRKGLATPGHDDRHVMCVWKLAEVGVPLSRTLFVAARSSSSRWGLWEMGEGQHAM
jgi:hypothetical protein